VTFVEKKILFTEEAKLISVGLYHTFVVSTTNSIYSCQNDIELPYMLLVEDFNSKSEIIDMKSGNSQTIVLTKDGLVYKIDH
jgi:alpha-tubulin suppressor-like RCC1 family protein